MINNFVVYIHYTADSNIPFYVGEGRPIRATTFKKRNDKWHEMFNKHGCKVKIISINLTKLEATRLEAKIIKGLRKSGYYLVNKLKSNITSFTKEWKNLRLSQWNREHRGEKSPTFGLQRPDLIERNKNGNFNRFTKSILCIETNIIYKSIKEATIVHNKNPKDTTISKYLRGDRKHAFGFQWKYV